VEKEILESAGTCECGKKHALSFHEVEVSTLALEKLIEQLKSNYREIILLYDGHALEEIETIKSGLPNVSLNIIELPSVSATLYLAKKLEKKQGEIVVAVGSEELISVAKFYSCLIGKDLIIYPKHNFADFTFSSFCRLYDGVEFNFYNCQLPRAVYVCPRKVANKYQTYYISSKFLTMLDNIVASSVFSNNYCAKMVDFFCETANNYVSDKKVYSSLDEKNIWTLIRLGEAMTYFGETKYFFGADKAIVDLLQGARFGADYLEMESIALKLVINSYSCFLKSPIKSLESNLSLHAQKATKLFKVPVTEVIKRISSKSVYENPEEIIKRFNNYQPYLISSFEKLMGKVFKIHTMISMNENVLLKSKFNKETISLCFALAPDFAKRESLLSVMSLFGYMDKLLV